MGENRLHVVFGAGQVGSVLAGRKRLTSRAVSTRTWPMRKLGFRPSQAR
jgi:hypothetical protein